ncbi:MAG: hypothetical protein H7832_14735 [Magnetococcus sp. DMHC-6]
MGISKSQVTEENYELVYRYVEEHIGRQWKLSPSTIDKFQRLPIKCDPEGTAIQTLEMWIQRHLLLQTRLVMFDVIREIQFEKAKGGVQILLSSETHRSLREFRIATFGEGKGSMELAVRALLDGVSRQLKPETKQQLEQYATAAQLKNIDQAVVHMLSLVDSARKTDPVKKELQEMLQNLKKGSNEI